MLINVITAVTRPENLAGIAASILAAQELDSGVNIDWHRYADPDREFVGGQHPKNIMISRIKKGWICILDDDTIMHASYLRRVHRASRQNPKANAIVVSQRRTNNTVLEAKPENMKVGMVDAGQLLIRRERIGDEYIPETYAGDGEWIEALLQGRDDVVYLPQVLSLHNALSGVDVSEPPERMQK